MPGNVPAATRALAILQKLASAPGPTSAATLARELDLPRSSTYHLLTAMAAEGFVAHYPEEERWGLGVAAFEIGAAYLRHDPLERWGRPLIHRLAEQASALASVVAHLGVLHGRETLYLVTETAPRAAVTVVAEVGVRLPASLTASGRAILGALPPAQVRALFPSRASFVDRTGRGPASPTALNRLLAMERERAWAEEDGFIVDGYASVAVAARDHTQRPVASIGLTFRSDRVEAATRAELARLAARAATILSTRLGGR
jgi:DNA-binding IclR family transcriptional regulator